MLQQAFGSTIGQLHSCAAKCQYCSGTSTALLSSPVHQRTEAPSMYCTSKYIKDRFEARLPMPKGMAYKE
jgi:hypothetical protein